MKQATSPPTLSLLTNVPSMSNIGRRIAAHISGEKKNKKHAIGYYNHVQLMSTPDGSVRLERILRR
jgi:hypothetical protein